MRLVVQTNLYFWVVTMEMIDRTDRNSRISDPLNYTRQIVGAVVIWDDCRRCLYCRQTRNGNDICDRTGRLLEIYKVLTPTVSSFWYDSFKIPEWCPFRKQKILVSMDCGEKLTIRELLDTTYQR